MRIYKVNVSPYIFKYYEQATTISFKEKKHKVYIKMSSLSLILKNTDLNSAVQKKYNVNCTYMEFKVF